VRRPSNIFAMKAPSGFTQTKISAKKRAICKIPLLVMIFLSALAQNFSGRSSA
jgi:hypothetical protein